MRPYALLALLALPIASRADIQYRVRLDPATETYVLFVEAKAKTSQTTFRIPAWSPGYYTLAHYEKQIKDVTAQDGEGHSLPIVHADPRAWTVDAPTGSTIRLSYKLNGNDPAIGFFGFYLDNRIGFINGASTFMFIEGRTTEPDRLDIKLPEGWDIATGMEKDDKGMVATTGYDELIDNPIQLGDFVRKKFTVEGIPFEAVYAVKTGKPASDLDKNTEILRKVSAPAIRMFRGAGFKHYTYIMHLAAGGFGGGLEHRASTCISVPNQGNLDGLDDLAAHENFHAWNVKQIRPFVLGPFDYTQPDRTANLWWMEGVTDYYAKVLTYRSGLEDSDWLLRQIREQMEELQGSRVRTQMSVADCSRQTWESGGLSVGDFSFYNKGFLIGAIFDASIRAQTGGKKSLDDVMRKLFAEYRLPNAGLQEDGILKALNDVVGKPGVFDQLYNQMVNTTDDLPYDILRNLGIETMMPGKPYAVPGFQLQSSYVSYVGHEADEAGLKVGDKVVGVNETPWAGIAAPPSGYTVEVERNGSLVKVEVPYTLMQGSGLDIMWDPTVAAQALELKKGWLERPDRSVKEGDKRSEGN